tara:strand:- start:85 stop:717 length:633 start_codon:yes stop_codon:yes gene_type:complete
MSWQALAFVDKLEPKPKPIEQLILIYMAQWSDDEFMSYPSIDTLSKRCNADARTIRRAIDVLTERKLIRVEKRYLPDGKQTSNRYFILIGGDKKEGVGVTKMLPNNIRDININKKQKGGDKYSKEFEEWWNVYPQRPNSSKYQAFQSWKKAIDLHIGIRELFLSTCKFKQICNGKDSKFIPHASTWLNQRRWETVGNPKPQATNKNSLAG